MAKKWSPLTGINTYVDGGTTRPVPLFDYCGSSYCKKWRDTNRERLAKVLGCEVKTIRVKRVGPRQWDIMFQIYNVRNRHSKLQNWFGSACCEKCAEAKAFCDYYDSINWGG